MKLLLSCLLVCFCHLMAQSIEVPLDVQFDFLLKATSFDTALKPKQGEKLEIAVIYQSSLMESVQSLKEIQNYIKANPNKIVHGYPVHFRSFDLNEPKALDSLVRVDAIDIIYVLPLRAIDIKMIAKIAKERQVHTLTAVPDYVRQGLAMSMRKKGEKPEVLFNLQALTDEGSEFPLKILKLGVLVDK